MARKESKSSPAPSAPPATASSNNDSNGAGVIDAVDPVDDDSPLEPAQDGELESPSKPPVSAAPAAISRGAIARATRAGLTDEEIDSCESEGALLRAASIAERYMSQRPRSNQQQQDAPAPKAEDVNLDEIPDFDEKDFNEEAKPSVKALNGAKKALKVYGARIQSLEGQLVARDKRIDSLESGLDRRDQRDWLEYKFSSLEGAEDVYGKGGFHAIKNNAAHLAARNKLVKLYEEMRRKDSLIDEAAFDAAHAQAFGRERAALAGRQKQNEAQVIGRPTQRKRGTTATTGGFESAVEKARNILKAGA